MLLSGHDLDKVKNARLVVLMHHPYGEVKQRTQFLFEDADDTVIITRRIAAPAPANVICAPHLPPLRLLALFPLFLFFAGLARLYFHLTTRKDATFVLTHEAQVYLVPETRRFVFDCHDDNPAFFEGPTKEAYKRARVVCLRRAAKVVASSASLQKLIFSATGGAVESTLIENGYLESFRRPYRRPKDKRVVYFGSIEFWFDGDAILQLAADGFRIRLIGPVRTALPEHPNIELAGPRNHSALISECEHADLLVLPFRRIPLVDGVNPVKLYEYVALGRPILSSYWPALDEFSGLLTFYNDVEDVVEAANRALHFEPDAARREEFLSRTSWRSRRATYKQVLDQL